ncbi:MAG: chemotaxis protein CheA [Thermincola sp.]|nr:chemotaxis protein CheA [Thermincola sp.]MDT3701771.1 chemotaxis protein CheA [Thermincola sp.]
MNMSQYINVFLEEAREHLQKLNEFLLELEGSPDCRETLDNIFRSAHTLKGMSATMGFTQVTELTHDMENVLHKLRNGEIRNSKIIIDLLFKSLDMLDNMISNIADGGTGSLPIDSLAADLKNCAHALFQPEPDNNIVTSFEFNEYEKNLIRQAIDLGFECYHLIVNIDSRCVMKSARAFMVFKNMEEIGEIIKCIPNVHEIEEEKFGSSFDLIIISREPRDVVRRGLISIAEVNEPEIKSITEVFTSLNAMGNARSTAQQANLQPTPEVQAAPKKNQLQAVQAKVKTSQTIRVDTARLDSLMNLVGELVINKTRLEQIGRNAQIPDLSETTEQIDRITTDLQNVVMKVRMVPIEHVFSRFPRMVRDLARDLSKEIELVIEGSETELDRNVIDEIGDPLVHLLRNAVDHGIEEPAARIAAGKPEGGRVALTARHEGNNVIIEVIDDGKGLDPEKIVKKAVQKGLLLPQEAQVMETQAVNGLVFLPGFSTAEKVTDVSGRGVGLDAVKSKIEALSGSLQLESVPEQGTKFKIQLPLTLAIIQALLVSIERETYAIPLTFIAETTSILPAELNKIQEQEVMLQRGAVLPLVRLNQVLEVPPSDLPKEEEINIVIVRKGNRRIGLIVDSLLGQQEIVIKPLGKLLGNIPVIAGATILGSGQVSLIIDIASLF